MTKFSVSTVPADGLAPLGARTSAGTVMTKFATCIQYVYLNAVVWMALEPILS